MLKISIIHHRKQSKNVTKPVIQCLLKCIGVRATICIQQFFLFYFFFHESCINLQIMYHNKPLLRTGVPVHTNHRGYRKANLFYTNLSFNTTCSIQTLDCLPIQSHSPGPRL